MKEDDFLPNSFSFYNNKGDSEILATGHFGKRSDFARLELPLEASRRFARLEEASRSLASDYAGWKKRDKKLLLKREASRSL